MNLGVFLANFFLIYLEDVLHGLVTLDVFFRRCTSVLGRPCHPRLIVSYLLFLDFFLVGSDH